MPIACKKCNKRRKAKFIIKDNEKTMCYACLGLCRECLKPVESDKQDENRCDCEKLTAVQRVRVRVRQEYETCRQQKNFPTKYEEFSSRLMSMDFAIMGGYHICRWGPQS